ncbi:MAG: hypothetical protein ABIH49_00400 [archaeon]
MGKIKTPDWVLKGKTSPNSEKSKTKGKTFKIRTCPKCGSDNVGVVLIGEEGKKADNWECRKCGWKGRDIKQKNLSEEEFMKYLDEKGESVN